MGFFTGKPSVQIISNVDEFLKASRESAIKALEAVGIQCESHAVKNLKNAGRGKGKLSKSITHLVDPVEPAVYVGTNVHYAIYNEVGTGIHNEAGHATKGWWVYVEGSDNVGPGNSKRYTYEEAAQIMAILRSRGIPAHMTQGMKGVHFIRDAVAGHEQEYKNIIEEHLEKG